MLADLHAHYPMHVLGDVTRKATLKRMRNVLGRRGVDNKWRAAVLWAASLLFNKRDWVSKYRISVDGLRAGGVGLAMSVLYGPFEEMDLDEAYSAAPRSDYFERLEQDLLAMESEVAEQDPSRIRFVSNRVELDECLDDGATALVHCVEGGFHLGDADEEIQQNVATLAGYGVAYITVAHLFFRQVATNSPALPFLSDRAYDWLFPQAEGEGLTERGKVLLRAMVSNRILIDISHMRADAIEETFRMLDRELDRPGQVPVISTHAGFRFGEQVYMHDRDTVERIARRGGVIGLIMAQHQLNDGVLRGGTRNFPESFDVIRRHIDRIASITGSHEHVALGTDFDGFIKPTMGGLEAMGDLWRLEDALRETYGEADASLIASDNALRVLKAVWT